MSSFWPQKSQIHLNVSQKRKVTNKKEWDEKVDKIKEESTLEDFESRYKKKLNLRSSAEIVWRVKEEKKS